MNDRINELFNQSHTAFNGVVYEFDPEKFAKLIIEECISACQTDRLCKTAGAEDLINKHFGIDL